MIGIIMLAVLTEGLSKLRFKLQRSFKGHPQRKRWAITGMHGLQALFGYILMLATMTFSVELLLCVIVGLGIGYAAFYDEQDPHVTSNPCCSYIQAEANERTSRMAAGTVEAADGYAAGTRVNPTEETALMETNAKSSR